MFAHKVYENQDIYRILADVFRVEDKFHASSINCPGCFSQADTFPEALDNLKIEAGNWIRNFITKQQPIEWAENDKIKTHQCRGYRSTIFIEVKPDA